MYSPSKQNNKHVKTPGKGCRLLTLPFIVIFKVELKFSETTQLFTRNVLIANFFV